MTLTATDLPLDGGPHGVRDARRWIVGAIAEIGRPDLAECAEMGVSELTTNALLHGATPIVVRIAGTREHPRIEVRDASTEPPVLPDRPEEDEGAGEDGAAEGDGLGGLGTFDGLDEFDGLLTFGRGLSIVARASDAWGTEIESDGKVVWFEPASEFSEHEGPVGTVTGVQVVADPPTPAADAAHTSGAVELRLLGVPVGALGDFERYFRELRREVRLLALAHHEDYPMAQDLADLFGRLERPIQRAIAAERLAAARHRGRPAVDLVVHLSRHQAREMRRFVDLLDLTDAFCREEKLLALARTRPQRLFQNWFLSEIADQADGQPVRSWPGADASQVRHSSAS